MPTSYTSLIGLALPVTGELAGVWGDTVNNYITNYLDSAVAGTQTISGTQTAVTLSVTNGSSLVTAGSGSTGSAQFQIINCTGNPAGLLTITAPASSRQYIIINATSTSQSVKIVGAGPTTGVTILSGEKAHVAWNGSDFVKIATQSGNGSFVDLTVSGSMTLSGGTANGVLYLNGSKVATSGSALVFDGTNLGIGTSSPGAKTEIYVTRTSSTNAVSLILNDNVTGTQTNGVYKAIRSVSNGGSAVSEIRFMETDGTNNNTSISFATQSAASALTERLRIDQNGNLGLGVTPSAWTTAATTQALQITNYGAALSSNGAGNTWSSLTHNAYFDGTNWKYTASTVGATLYQMTGANSGSTHSWSVAAGGTAGTNISFTQAMTLDASGNLGVGTTSPSTFGKLAVQVAGTTTPTNLTNVGPSSINLYAATNGISTDGTMGIFGWNATTGIGSGIGFSRENSSDWGTQIRFYTHPTTTSNIGDITERARITSGGYFKASNTGSYIGSTSSFHETVSNATSDGVLVVESTSASYTSYILSPVSNRNTTNNTYYAIGYFHRGAGAYKFLVADSGNVTNTNGSYGTISDVKMKTDIVDAGSQWADIKAIRFRKFKMKDDPEQIVQLGVVAQEVEQTSPGLVEEHQDRNEKGESLGTTTKSVKTSVLLMKAAVALQEAMTRIEQLEAKVAALESKGA